MSEFRELTEAEVAKLSSSERRMYLRQLKEYKNRQNVSTVLSSEPDRGESMASQVVPKPVEQTHAPEQIAPVSPVQNEPVHIINTVDTINTTNIEKQNPQDGAKEDASVIQEQVAAPVQVPVIEKPKTVSNDKSTFTSICFETTFDRADYIRRMSFRNHMTKEEMYAALFENTMDMEIDFKDPLYRTLTERSKKDSKITTRLNKDLLQRMRDRAADNYMNIGAYINYVIQKHMDQND